MTCPSHSRDSVAEHFSSWLDRCEGFVLAHEPLQASRSEARANAFFTQDKPPPKPKEDPKAEEGPKFTAFGGKPNKLR